MTSKLPWVAATLIIVAALGAWALSLGGPVPVAEKEKPEPEAEGKWSEITIWTAGQLDASGIENVYFFNHGFGADDDLNNDNNWYTGTVNADNCGPYENENIYEYNDNDQVLRASGDTVNVIADNAFDLVITYKVDSAQCVDPTDSTKFNLQLQYTLNGVQVDAENDNTVIRFCFDNDTGFTAAGSKWGRWANVYNGGGNGYTVTAGNTFTIDNLMLLCWK